MSLTKLSMRRPITTLMVFLCFVMLGVITTPLIPLEYFPDLSEPNLWINIPYPGSTPEEVEREILRPVEEVLATMSDVRRMNSDAREDGASVRLNYDWGVDIKLKALEAREKLNGIQDQLPVDVERIFVNQWSTEDMPIMELRISASRDLSDSYELLDRKVKRLIERVEGVSQVELYGVQPKEVRIELLADRIAAHHINLPQLVGELQQANFSVTAGQITDSGRRFVVRPTGEITSVEQIGNLVITPNGLRLRDIAEVVYDDPRREEGRHLDGDFAIGLNVRKEAGMNTVVVARDVREALQGLDEDPEMAGINIYFMDNVADGIVSSLRELLEAGLLGAFFATLVLYFFLRRFSTTLIVTLAVPISLLITVAALYFFGLSLNILTMMGLMLAVGMLVDNAVVVTESIHRRQRLEPGDAVAATKRGVKEVALAITAGTITTGAVFLPIIVSPSDEVTVFLRHVSITICVALAASLLIAQTVVPLLTARLKPPKAEKQSKFVDGMTERYGNMLGWLMRHRKTSAGLVLGILVSVAIPATLVNSDFFPDNSTERRVWLVYHLHGTYPLDRVEEAVSKVEANLLAKKDELEITSIYTYFRSDWATSTILLTEGSDIEKEVPEIKELIRENLPQLAIANPSFDWSSGGNGIESVRVMVSGESSDVLANLSHMVAERLSHIEGLTDVRSEATAGNEEVRIVVDRERAQQYGYSTQQVAQTVSFAMRGQNLRKFRTPEGEVDMRLTFQDADRQSLDDLRRLSMQNDGNQQLSLSSLADFEVSRGPYGIHREDRNTMWAISANLEEGTTSSDAQNRIRDVMERIELPAGYSWSFGQRFWEEEQSQNVMLMNLLLALVLIYIVMAALFESLIYPAAIWSSILFAIIGVYWFFLITNTTFSVMAWIGVLILIGVVVNNGIVLIDHINHLRAEGLPRMDAIVQGGMDRLRPILMTAATTVLGLIPLCISNAQIGGDGPPYYPMARAIVGGLAFSTIVTLIVLPSIYIMLDDLRTWSRRVVRFAAK